MGEDFESGISGSSVTLEGICAYTFVRTSPDNALRRVVRAYEGGRWRAAWLAACAMLPCSVLAYRAEALASCAVLFVVVLISSWMGRGCGLAIIPGLQAGTLVAVSCGVGHWALVAASLILAIGAWRARRDELRYLLTSIVITGVVCRVVGPT